MAWGFGDDTDAAAQRIMTEQRRAGFDLPDGMMILGVPLGTVRQNDAHWSRYQLPDGREIGIASTDWKKNNADGNRHMDPAPS
jgi:hypothetical protein